jgi:hypothetical protein
VTATLQRFSQPFDTAWYTGAAVVSDDIPNKYQVAIGGHGYIIDISQYDRSTLPIRRQPLDDSIEPGEQSLSQEGIWRRSQDNWFLGMGQEYLDNRFTFLAVYQRNGEDPSVRSRSWHSQGLNPWNEGQLSLLPEQTMALTSSSSPWVIDVGGDLYYWDGTSLQVCTDPMPGSLSWTTVDPPSGSWPAVTSPATDGYNLWLAAGVDGIITTTQGSTSSSVLRQTPAAPSVAVTATGSDSFDYWIVGTDVNGFKTLVSPETTVTNGDASAPNNTVSWTDIPGIVSWDILRGDTSHSVALGVTGTDYVDTTVNATAGYTPPTGTTDNLQADFLGYANGFLIGGQGPLLASVAANGTTELLWTHPNPEFAWKASGPSPMCIYLAGDAGGNSELFATTLDSTTEGLSAPYLAGQVGNGELIRAMTYYQGLMMIGTSIGIRTAQDTQSNGHLTTGPVITDPGDVKCVSCYGPFCWFGWSDYDTDDGINSNPSTTSGTGRLFLSEYTTDPLVPAYAPDVAATLGTSGVVTSLAVIGGDVYFTIDGAGGLWGPSGNLVETGFLETGWIRYGLTQAKILLAVDLRHDPLAGTIDIEGVPLGDETFLIGTSAVAGSTGPAQPISGGNRVTQAYNLVFTLNRDTDDATQGPLMRSWTCESLPVVTRQDQIVVPVMLAQTVRSPVREGAIVRYDPLAEFQYIKGLESTAAPIIYQEGDLSYTVVVDQVQVKAEKWADDFSWFEGICLVRLLTLDIDS